MPKTYKRLGNRRLTGEEFGLLSKVLQGVFNHFTFQQMLKVYVDENLGRITSPEKGMDEVVFRVIDTAEAENWTADLLIGARAMRPHDDKLLAFAQRFDLAPAVEYVRDALPLPGENPRQQLERQIRKSNSALDVAFWRTQLAKAEACVCRIVIVSGGSRTSGTGFLVAPDLVLTNYHVVEKVIRGEVSAERVTFYFDYKIGPNGVELQKSTPYVLAPARQDDPRPWLLDYSEDDPLDDRVTPLDGPAPPHDRLDYALLRLHKAAGADPIGGVANPQGGAPRGRLELPAGTHDFAPDSALFILQHPEGAPLKLTLDTESIIGVNANGTRVRYRTNTEKGSSGSPCFDAEWNLVALHHAGDPNFDRRHAPTYNQGIPISAIVARLQQREILPFPDSGGSNDDL